ncbi:MAG: tetratricopeptide repeat protein [Ignavibacteriales bacterium]|nr:tetratricopeptide repeat protein [Ignavibacteriales bacterium]
MNSQNYFDASSSKTDTGINSFVYNIIGVNQADNRNYKDALELFTEAIKLNPNDSVAFFNRASIEMQLGLYKEARKDFKESAKLELNSDFG